MLSLLSWIYGIFADLRNTLYERSVFESTSLGARTISIGNITTGGTGKTPLVAYAAEILTARGEIVCILSRGYGRRNPKKRVLVSDGKQILAEVDAAGDEPLELARKLLGKAMVIADADRAAAGEWAKRKFGVTAFVLDDGFQHRKVKRDLDIVCIDGADPFGRGKLLPAGRLRERPENLERADIVALMRSQEGVHLELLHGDVRRLAPNAAIFEVERSIKSVTALGSSAGAVAFPAKSPPKSFAFCGLGNPGNFLSHLMQEGIGIVGTQAFPDHYKYRQRDIREIEEAATAVGATVLLTTAKDAVKLDGLNFQLPCYVVEVELEISDPEGFARLL